MARRDISKGGTREGEAFRESAREALSEACRSCERRDSALHPQDLCACVVALSRRRLVHALRSGDDPGVLDADERGALHLQAWAAAAPPETADAGRVVEALDRLERGHASCELPGCLTCACRESLRRQAVRKAPVA